MIGLKNNDIYIFDFFPENKKVSLPFIIDEGYNGNLWKNQNLFFGSSTQGIIIYNYLY